MSRPLWTAVVVASIMCQFVVLSGVGHAGGTPGQVCAGAKLKATGKSAGVRLGCHATAAKQGVTVDAMCLAKAGSKLDASFANAEAHGGCVTTGDAGSIAAVLDSSVGAFVTALRPNPTANRCASGKLKASGKKAKSKLGCQAKATLRGVAVDPACLAKAEARFAAAFAMAEAHPPCLTTGDAAAVESQVDALVDTVLTALPSGTTTTTTTSTTTTTLLSPGCGNGFLEAGEQCDTVSEPICVSSGRSGCFPAGGPNQCRCCTLPGEIGAIDPSGLNECCNGASPQPISPGHYLCPGTCSSTPFPTCGGSCPFGTSCLPLSLGGTNLCGCVSPTPCETCGGGVCPVGEACNGNTCSCFVP